MTPTTDSAAGRRRALLRRFIRDRGPDIQRDVDRLKVRSGPGGEVSEELLSLYESGAVHFGNTHELTNTHGDPLFMLDVSEFGSGDPLE